MVKFILYGLLGAGLTFASSNVLLAQTFELRGSGILPDLGAAPVGVPGETITVSVTLSSADFQYVPLDNSVVQYFAPSTTIPVGIVGSESGEYSAVSPIARFVAWDLQGSTGGDMLGLDVAAGTSGTSLLNLSTIGTNGFDDVERPHSPEDLFSLFAEAVNNQRFWKPSPSSAVLVGPEAELLFLGQLEWTIINPIAGDFDGNGVVDGRDFLAWQRNPSVGDLAQWQHNYGDGMSLPTSLVVPEPATGAVLIMGACLAAVSRRSFPRLP